MLPLTWMWWNQECNRLCFLALSCDCSCSGVHLDACMFDSAPQCIRFKWYLAQKSLGPIKALANENTNKNRLDRTLINLHLSAYSLKTWKWSVKGHVLYFQAPADPEVTSQEDRRPLGSSFDDLIHRSAGNELVSPSSSPGSWENWEPQGTWSTSQINIMELIDQLKFSRGTVLECTHSFSVCNSLRSKITSLHSLFHTWIWAFGSH